MRVADAKDRISISLNRLANEKARLEDFKTRLRVTAPQEGFFAASVGLGGFVKKGDPIGFLTI